MIIAGALLLGAVLVGWLAPVPLSRLALRQREAILRHERHHLHRGHHWLIIATGAVTDALPRVPLFRAAALTAIITLAC